MSACVPNLSNDQLMLKADKLGAKSTFDGWPSESWWLEFHDDSLTKLINQALFNNPTLTEAAKRLDKAVEYSNVAGALMSPQLNLNASVSRQRLSENSFYPPPFSGSQQTVADTALYASWDLDFWGKNQAALNASLSNIEVAKAQAEEARLIVSVSVARTYYQLAGLLEQKKIAIIEVQLQKKIMEMIEIRIKAGLENNAALYQSKISLPQAQLQLKRIEASLEITRNALAALSAQSPEVIMQLMPDLPTATIQAIPEHVPADLIGRRPDIAVAKARIKATSFDMESAKAEFYPNISLTAFMGLSSFGLSKFLDIGSTVSGAGPAMHLPIFDNGRLKANLKYKSKDVELAVNSYNQVLIDAIHEVADQITSLNSVFSQIEDQKTALSAAESASKLDLVRYNKGLATLIEVRISEESVLKTRRQLLQLTVSQLDYEIALIKSLGGGFKIANVYYPASSVTLQNSINKTK